MIRVRKSKDYAEAFITFGVASEPCFHLLVPLTEARREQGLQKFPKPGPREGMLFTSDNDWPNVGRVSMWLASVSTALDMVWLDAGGHVLAVRPEIRPGDPRTFSYQALACVEVAGGTCKRLGIKDGTPYALHGGSCAQPLDLLL